MIYYTVEVRNQDTGIWKEWKRFLPDYQDELAGDEPVVEARKRAIKVCRQFERTNDARVLEYFTPEMKSVIIRKNRQFIDEV